MRLAGVWSRRSAAAARRIAPSVELPCSRAAAATAAGGTHSRDDRLIICDFLLFYFADPV